MADDPYAVLGVPRDASEEDIRRVFRKLAKELHPDLRPGDKTAGERFKRVSAAYDLLGDPVKRRRFDRGEIDASGEPRRAYAHGGQGARTRWQTGGGADDFDVFDVFGGGFRPGRTRPAPMRGPDARYTLEIEFLEALTGVKKRVTLPEGGILDLVVPEGVADGQVLRLKGKGAAGTRGGEPGDALVELKVKPHSQFKRLGDDIMIEVPISIDEAVLGGRIEVPTPAGRVQLTLPKGTSSGRVFRLRGKGIKNTTTGASGDQLVSVRIDLPSTIDDNLAYFLGEWRQKYGYDPRKI